jgi:DNA modification methylase
MHHTLLVGDVRQALRTLPEKSIQTCITSPPYWGLRDYGTPGQLGLEPTPEEYVANMVDVFREVRRVLRDDGTLWLNLGDCYITSPPGNKTPPKDLDGNYRRKQERQLGHGESKEAIYQKIKCSGLKQKDLVGQPWRVAFALQADGWYLRSDIIWHKPNPMPESVTDRPTKAHEYIFLLSKSEKYYYDADAIREKGVYPAGTKGGKGSQARNRQKGVNSRPEEYATYSGTRNKRTVWTVATRPFPGSHFATFPPELIEPCILAGSPKGGTVLDPFGGSGTTTMMAEKLGRDSVYIDLNPEYLDLAKERCGFGGKLIDTATYEIREV